MGWNCDVCNYENDSEDLVCRCCGKEKKKSKIGDKKLDLSTHWFFGPTAAVCPNCGWKSYFKPRISLLGLEICPDCGEKLYVVPKYYWRQLKFVIFCILILWAIAAILFLLAGIIVGIFENI